MGAANHAEERFDKTLRAVRLGKLPASRRHLVDRHPVDAIPLVAKENRIDIVVMGLVRLGIKGLLIGNTAQQLLDGPALRPAHRQAAGLHDARAGEGARAAAGVAGSALRRRLNEQPFTENSHAHREDHVPPRHHLRDLRVEEAMAGKVLTCRASDEVQDAQRQMENEQIRRLPVVGNQDELIGIVSIGGHRQGIRPHAAQPAPRDPGQRGHYHAGTDLHATS